jgi:hypothetical protein
VAKGTKPPFQLFPKGKRHFGGVLRGILLAISIERRRPLVTSFLGVTTKSKWLKDPLQNRHEVSSRTSFVRDLRLIPPKKETLNSFGEFFEECF